MAALLVAGALGAYAVGALSHLPDLQEALEDTADTLGAWTYLVASGGALLETGTLLGVVVPFEFAVILGGAVAAQDQIALLPVIGLAWLGAFAGEVANYVVGDRVGHAFALRYGPRVAITPARLDKAHVWFERHGGKAVALAPFIPLMRSTVPFLAGASEMSFRRFLACSLGGTAAWAAAFSGLGYAFYESLGTVADVLTFAGLAILAIGLVAYLLVRRSRRRAIA